MASIFNALHIGYSGLNAAQVGINTTSHNLSNAENENYTRQRVVQAAATPISQYPGQVGNGVQVTEIKRVFDNFVFDRFVSVSTDKEFSDYEKRKLEELSTYFPEIDGVGIKTDLQNYYNMWQSFADNPDNDAIKLALAEQTKTLSQSISTTQNKILKLQSQINDELKVTVDEVNRLAKELASLNISIDTAEAAGTSEANDLRDKRNAIELTLGKLIGAEAMTGQMQSNTQFHSQSNTKSGSYTLSINGFNIVDGNTYHPLHISKDTNPNGFYEISYERQDGVLIPMEETLKKGKVGAMLSLRGGTIDTTSGTPNDGVIQNTIAQMDAFAKGLIESTNNLYAQTPVTRMDSNPLPLNGNDTLLNSGLNFKAGSFEVVIFDIDGNEVATRSININAATTMEGLPGSNSIKGQIENKNIDDNNDGNANNDVDDYITFTWGTHITGGNVFDLSMDGVKKSQGFTFAIRDTNIGDNFSTGTNFAGVTGVNTFFEGDKATDINLSTKYRSNPTLLSAGKTTIAGDNRVALDMIQNQYEKYDFKIGSQIFNTTTYGMFDTLATQVGSVTNASMFKNDALSAQFHATQMEFFSISKVSIDEEMTNLIKFQTSYGAAAKIITTIDQMMQTLLGIKS
ncbi:MAG: flagellar hook-associated protein FlgK [Sulfurimonadaceae bacterium]|jgi:flagellar hook-associated protein 1 FlgK|nr:flagellar hook-associated protein FlgK [Sulfurimonadaceae bacterium]